MFWMYGGGIKGCRRIDVGGGGRKRKEMEEEEGLTLLDILCSLLFVLT